MKADLIEHETRLRFGGACHFSSAPSLPPPPPPPPTRDDPAIAEARKKQRLSELLRRGRRASIIFGGQAGAADAPLSQPRAAKLGN